MASSEAIAVKTHRVCLGIHYLGTQYRGWQSQIGMPSIQACIEEALGQITKATIKVVCAGRTDAGVHATGQVIHFDTEHDWEPRVWVMGANRFLPKDIGVHAASSVSMNFHARFSAHKRTYQYVIFNHRIKPTLWLPQVTWVKQPLDTEQMHLAAQQLVGEHDFTSFRSTDCQANHPNRHIHSIVFKQNGPWVIMQITANAFLHHMVRNIVGTMFLVGKKYRPMEWVEEVLRVKRRSCAGMTAPANGLYFTNVNYPDDFALKIPSMPQPWDTHLNDGSYHRKI